MSLWYITMAIGAGEDDCYVMVEVGARLYRMLLEATHLFEVLRDASDLDCLVNDPIEVRFSLGAGGPIWFLRDLPSDWWLSDSTPNADEIREYKWLDLPKEYTPSETYLLQESLYTELDLMALCIDFRGQVSFYGGDMSTLCLAPAMMGTTLERIAALGEEE
jgi:hypothetical protein